MKLDYSNVNEYELLPEGEYEMLIEKSGLEIDNKNRERISLQMVVRNDVNQPNKNAKLFHSIYKSKEPKPIDMQSNGYSFASLMQIAKAVRLEENKDYPSLQALIADFINRPVKATIYHDTYNGKTSARVQWWKQTSNPTVMHQAGARQVVSSSQFSAASQPTAGAYAPAPSDADAPPAVKTKLPWE